MNIHEENSGEVPCQNVWWDKRVAASQRCLPEVPPECTGQAGYYSKLFKKIIGYSLKYFKFD